MKMKKQLTVLSIFLLVTSALYAQIEIANVRYKSFSGVGFGAFFNFAVPVSQADYTTIEAGAYYAKDKDDFEVILIPFLLGYRYTVNRSGSGLYVEPTAGYGIGSADVQDYNDAKNSSGVTAGMGLGYLFEQGRILFNLALRYEHCFGADGTNVISFRISHAFSLRRRE